MANIERLPNGYWIEGNAIKKDDDGVIIIAHFTRSPVSKVNQQKRQEFAAAMRDEQAEQIIAELCAALQTARDNMQAWQAYASDYFKEKHGASDDLATCDEALAKARQYQNKENG